MHITANGFTAALARAASIVLAGLALASCGSGAVSGSAPVNDPNRITVLPGTATLYSGLPTSFVISGGTGSYIVSSSNQAIVPIAGSLPTNAFTVVPNEVTSDTEVTLTVRDTGSTPVATATLTVRPGTVGNEITITPSSTQGGGCQPAICSGGDAEVSVLLSRGGQPLVSRGVRFEVVSGDYRFITSQPGSPVESTDFTTTTVTDESGRARARLRTTASANNQTAILRIVDLGSGASRTTSFNIAQATGTSPGFFASPTGITFSGPNDQECASSGSADVYVYGGTPPYSVSTVGAPFIVSREFVGFSGGSFSVLPRGICVAEPGAPITIQDASGRTTTVRVANVLGARAVPSLVVAPQTVTLSQCNSLASVSVGGGTGVYAVSSGSGSIFARLAGDNTITIGRVPNTTGTSPVSVGVTSGNQAATVVVNVTGGALSRCDGAPFQASTNFVMLDSCGPVNVLLSGGSGTYAATSNSSFITATVSGSTLTIQRAVGTQSTATVSAVVTATDGAARAFIDVRAPAGFPATCP